MPEIKEVFQGVLVKAHNMTEAEVSSLFTEDGNLKDDAETLILNRQAEQVQKARDKAKAEREEQYKRGLREKGSEFEKLLKEAGVELGDAIGADAVKKLNEHIESKTKPSDLDDDKVKGSKLYREMEKTFQKQLSDKEQEYAKAMQERDAKEQRERTLSDVKGKAKLVLEELKPVLSEDPKKAANQLKMFYQELEGHDYEVDGDDFLIKRKDGTRVETQAGHPMKLADFARSTAEQYYDFQVSEKKGSAGDVTKGTKTGDVIKLQKPTTRQGLADQIYKINEDNSLKPDEKAKLVTELKGLAPELT